MIRDADKKSFADIERDIAALSVKARDNLIELEDMAGGTFTISNGGNRSHLFLSPFLLTFNFKGSLDL